jgi:hypothetical protein
VTRWYVALLSLAVAVPALIGGVRSLSSFLATRHETVTPQPLPLALCLLWTAAWLMLAARLGPLTLHPATLAWRWSAPVSRRRLLLPAYALTLACGVLAGLALAALIIFATAPAPAAAWALLCFYSLAGVTAGASLVLLQLFSRRPARLIELSAGFCCAAAIVLTVLPDGLTASPAPVLPTGAIALAASVLALLTLGRMPTVAVRQGASFAQIMRAGVVTLDPGLAARATEDGRVTASRRGRLIRGDAALAIVAQDLLSLRRAPHRWLSFAAFAAAPALIAQLFAHGWIFGLAWLLCGLCAVSLVAGNIRRDRDIPALPRLLTLSPARSLTARAAVPVAAGLLWPLLSLPLLAQPFPATAWLAAAAAAPAFAAGAIRSARRGRVRHELAPIVTPAGLIPTGLLHWLATGFDLGLLLLWPAALALTTSLSPATSPWPYLPLIQLTLSTLGLAALLRAAAASSNPPRA